MVLVEDYRASLNTSFQVTPLDNVVVVLCSVAAILTVIGNLLVLLGVVAFHKLRNKTNVLIASLAIADMLVGAIVMPISILYDFKKEWIFSTTMCTVWISFDVVCTTSSIFHIGCIAVDRFLTIMYPLRYPSFTSVAKLCALSVAIWTLSVIFVILPINLGWNKPPQNVGPVMITTQCFFITNGTYALITALVIFYGPLLFMTSLYMKIFKVVVEQVRRVQSRTRNQVVPVISIISMETQTMQNPQENDRNSVNASTSTGIDNKDTLPNTDIKNDSKRVNSAQSTPTSNYKAAKTLGMIMGCFFVCWFPFFLIYTVHPFKPSFVETKALSKFSIWLGYLNSCMNPVIYSRSKHFRLAFKKILRCRFTECRE